MNAMTLLEKLALKPPHSEVHGDLAALLRHAPPEEIEACAAGMLRTPALLPRYSVFFDSALSHVAEESCARLIAQAVEIMEREGESAAGESVIAYASLQFPHLLARYRQRLFALRPNRRAYYEHWYWRGADEASIAFLREKVASGDTDTARQAWESLLDTGNQQAIAYALAHVATLAFDPATKARLEMLARRQVAPLPYSAQCAHLVFPADYFADGVPWMSHTLHPTWTLPAQGAPLRFGGAGSGSCGLCGRQLHHLLTLPEKHVFANGSEAPLSLEVCLSCLGWEEHLLTYKYGADGRPHGVEKGARTPEFVAGPLLETEVHLAPTPARWQRQDWALANGRENLNRVGGAPCWIQDEDYPACPACGERMHFFMQLDSELPTADGQAWLWGSGGTGYALRCAPCRTVAWLWQCT